MKTMQEFAVEAARTWLFEEFNSEVEGDWIAESWAIDGRPETLEEYEAAVRDAVVELSRVKRVHLTLGRCDWGRSRSDFEDRSMHAKFEAHLFDGLTDRFPAADVRIVVDRGLSGAAPKIDTDGSYSDERRIEEALGAAWGYAIDHG